MVTGKLSVDAQYCKKNLLFSIKTVEEFNADPEMNVRHVIGDMPACRHLWGCQNQNSESGCKICKALMATRPSTHWPYRPGQREEYCTSEETKYYARLKTRN